MLTARMNFNDAVRVPFGDDFDGDSNGDGMSTNEYQKLFKSWPWNWQMNIAGNTGIGGMVSVVWMDDMIYWYR